MKQFVIICFVFVLAAVLGRPDQYTDRYDNTNVEEILENRRLLIPYLKCALDEGKCSPDGKELKSHIREALENHCEKCTEKQKAATKRVIKHLINKEPEFWKRLADKYDPEHKYVVKYEEELKEVQESA